MLKLVEKKDLHSCEKIYAEAVLPIDSRVKSRSKIYLNNGEEAGLFLPRGLLLRHGDIVSSSDGVNIKIIAAPEELSKVTASSPLELMRAAYHLGNRHVVLQVEENFLCYRHDKVLDDMLIGMGLKVKQVLEAFEPEAGAYQQLGGGHSHAH